ncbi:hypothetical protein M5D96_002618 [Drosophila gunungcola]|uniref:GDT1 family protein n=1 Tax=Drosophila gunungcola TaxID=103775 RepID=A0A9Q0BWK7_9MUSC|nr:hypothetical protein M5D96_002618 [Drosophila gunungcola]
MSQNQSYFWQTTRHNVYLKRTAKWHMALALMVVLTFGTICAAEAQPDSADNAVIESGIQSDMEMQADLNKPTDLSSLAEKPKDAADRPKTKGTFIDAFTASISVILLTELGDKTFFIAAIMAMRHPRLIVFGGAIAALALMTVLSCVFGMAANFIPKTYTYYISTALFLIFGLKMLYDGYKMKPTDAQEELEEVQSDLRKREDEMRKASRKYEDSEGKRKNSNSDKEDVSEQALIHGRSSVSAGAGATSIGDSDMQHRQRKQRNHLNNNNSTTHSNSKQNSCDKTGTDDEDRDQHESEVFLKEGGRIVEQLKMKTYHSSPAHSAASSNQTEQTNSIAASTTTVDVQLAGHPTDPSVGDASEPRAPLAGHDSMHSLNGSLNGDSAGPANGTLKARVRPESVFHAAPAPVSYSITFFEIGIERIFLWELI